MPDAVSQFLTPWSGFYLMTASAAAALTGLMFVVITLVTGTERIRRNPAGLSAFSTPTVVHFCMALFVSAVLIAPWRSLIHPAALLGFSALFGVAYMLRVVYLTKSLSAYEPDLEDWTWFTVLPFVAYGAILCGSIVLPRSPVEASFALASGVMLLIFIGIRNAWDIVTYIAVGLDDEPPNPS
jgi:hypothetical protein